MIMRCVITLLLLALASFLEARQVTHPKAGDTTLLAQLTARRDLFIRSVAAEGYSTCTTALPQVFHYGRPSLAPAAGQLPPPVTGAKSPTLMP
jgi:hypothetical protein